MHHIMCTPACRRNVHLFIQQKTSKLWWCDGRTSRYVAGCDPLVINTKLLILINLSHLFSLYCFCHILDAYLGTWKITYTPPVTSLKKIKGADILTEQRNRIPAFCCMTGEPPDRWQGESPWSPWMSECKLPEPFNLLKVTCWPYSAISTSKRGITPHCCLNHLCCSESQTCKLPLLNTPSFAETVSYRLSRLH